jgi:hypothetical protein
MWMCQSRASLAARTDFEGGAMFGYIGFALFLLFCYGIIQWGKRKAEQQGREEARRNSGGDKARPGTT